MYLISCEIKRKTKKLNRSIYTAEIIVFDVPGALDGVLSNPGPASDDEMTALLQTGENLANLVAYRGRWRFPSRDNLWAALQSVRDMFPFAHLILRNATAKTIVPAEATQSVGEFMLGGEQRLGIKFI